VTEARNPASIHAPLTSYSHQIEPRGPGRLLVLSGQVGMAPDVRLPDDPAEQLELAMDKAKRGFIWPASPRDSQDGPLPSFAASRS
jgi:enamine deaminase RidA (YjgF/YER057c/UK114 family)